MTAVDHLSVAIPKSECFGLLGVNGKKFWLEIFVDVQSKCNIDKENNSETIAICFYLYCSSQS